MSFFVERLTLLLTFTVVNCISLREVTIVNQKGGIDMKEVESMSRAEWQVMRIIWTLGQATSKQVIDFLEKKTDWKAATIKTLIGRLQKKNFLQADETKRPYVYQPLISEDEAIHDSVNDLFDNLCCMRKGYAIKDLIDNSEISKSDISAIIETLNQKKATAPEVVECDCLESDLNE